DPPESEDWPFDWLEPLFPIAKRSDVCAAIHELLQRVERLPDRQVDGHALVLERPDRRGVAVFGLKAPDESRAAVGQRIDGIELRPEAFHDRIVDRRAKAADVNLGEMEARHLGSFFAVLYECDSAAGGYSPR